VVSEHAVGERTVDDGQHLEGIAATVGVDLDLGADVAIHDAEEAGPDEIEGIVAREADEHRRIQQDLIL
jgi:hypothetical protein